MQHFKVLLMCVSFLAGCSLIASASDQWGGCGSLPALPDISTMAFTEAPLSAVSLTTNLASPQVAGTAITLQATATGGSTVQFEFNVYDPIAGAWTILQNTSSIATCTWTPTVGNTYTLNVIAYDSATGTMVSAQIPFIITGLPLTAVSFTTDPPSPSLGLFFMNEVELQATTTGGTAVKYMFWVYNAVHGNWTLLQAYSGSSVCWWGMLSPGTYLLSVSAQDGKTGTVVNSQQWYTLTGYQLTNVSLYPFSPASPQPVNTPITLTAYTNGGTSVQYLFWAFNATTGVWSQLQAYSTNATCAWTPSVAGNYLLSVTAYDVWDGTMVNTQQWFAVTGPPLTGVSFTCSPASPHPSNSPITLQATASGGAAVQYQFWVYNAASNAWSQLQPYSTNTNCPWTPTVAGSYLLSVSAKDGVTGTEVNSQQWFTAIGPPLTGVSVSTNPASPQPLNTPITLTATAIGGTTVQYMFWVYNAASGAWNQLQGYSANANCPWTPTTIGSYLLSVTALDTWNGTEVNTMQWYTVTGPPLTAVTLTSTLASPQSKNITIPLIATATGGTAVQYQFWYSNPPSYLEMNLLQDFSTNNQSNFSWGIRGPEILMVIARDSVYGNEVSATLPFTFD